MKIKLLVSALLLLVVLGAGAFVFFSTGRHESEKPEEEKPQVEEGKASEDAAEKEIHYDVGLFLFKYPDTILPDVVYCLWPSGSQTLAFQDCDDINFGQGEVVERHSVLDLLTDSKNKERKYEFETFYSLYYFPDYLASRASEYIDLTVNLDFQGVFDITESLPEPPEPDFVVGVEGINPYLGDYRFFRRMVEKKVDLSRFDRLVFVFLNDRSFQEREDIFDFSSIALDEEAVINLRIGPDLFYGRHIFVLSHEFQHLLGAKDLYEVRGSSLGACKIPEGIPDPDKSPLYPQVKACSMCGAVMTTENGPPQAASLDEIVICEAEAKEMGWTK